MSQSTRQACDFTVFAPGRVNLIGEHTDYNDGFVLPCAIERGLSFTVRTRSGTRCLLTSDRSDTPVEIDLEAPRQPGRVDWGRYIEGVIAGFERLGWSIPGFAAAISGNLPAGGGLSSSAALEVGIATVIETLCGRALQPVDKALLCQRAEHDFAGVPCGIMDQFAVSLARQGCGLLIDCRSHHVNHVPIGDDVALLVIDSGVKHALADGNYATRRRECAAAAEKLGLPSLRDVMNEDWPSAERQLPEPERRRARHVVSENARVQAFASAAARGDWPLAGGLMAASHASLRDDFAVSCHALDAICEAAESVTGVHGCRMTGGGFGGCAVALVDARRLDDAIEGCKVATARAIGQEPAMFLTRPAAAVSVA